MPSLMFVRSVVSRVEAHICIYTQTKQNGALFIRLLFQ